MSFWTRWRRLITVGPNLAKRVPAPKAARRVESRKLALEFLEQRTMPTAYTWAQTAAGTFAWNASANWGPAGVPNNNVDTANLNVAIAGNQTINLNQNVTVNQLTVGDRNTTLGTGTETIAPNGSFTLTFGTTTSPANLLNMPAGVVAGVTVSAPITLNANTTITNNSSQTLTISGNINTNTFALTINGSGAVIISGAISGTGSLIKAGTGTVTLTGTDTYFGTTTVGAGTLLVDGLVPNSLVTVNSGGTLGGTGTFGNNVTVSGGTLEAGDTGGTGILTVDNIAVLTGTLTSGSKAVTGLSGTSGLYVGQSVTGTGIPAGTTVASITSTTGLTLSANATASGSQNLTFVNAANFVYTGSLTSGSPTVTNLQNTGQTGTGTHSTGVITGLTSTTGLFVGQSVSGSGIGNNATITSINSATSVTVSGNLSNGTVGPLTFTGTAGTFVGQSVTGTGIPLGTTITAVSSSTQVTLSQSATITNSSASVTFSPNLNVTLGGTSTFAALLNGTTAGTGYDEFNDVGNVSLGGSTLSLAFGSGFSATAGSKFTLIKNGGGNAVSGTFSGLAEGSTLTVGGQKFTISYVGGTSGDDVVLTYVSGTTATAVTSSNSSSTYGNSVTFTATVGGGANTATPTGTVTFKDGGTTLGTGTLSGGVATFSTTALPVVAGGHSITAVYGGDGNFGGSTSTALTQTVSARPITVTAAANTKTYDGTATASAVPTITSGSLANGDTANFTEAYGGKSAGTGLTLTPSGSVNDGNGGGNYSYAFVTNTTGVINARPITVTAAANTKTYDGTTGASATPTITSGSLASGDSASFTEAYGDKSAGTGKTLIASGSVSDGNGGNDYAVTFVISTSGVINARLITVAAATNTKTYDGTTGAAATPTITSGTIVSGDTANFSESYGGKSAGTGLTLTPSGTVIDGNGGNNYSYAFVTNTTGVINKAALTVSAAGVNKTYDGTAAATVTLSDNRVSGDVFTDSYAGASFADKNVGSGKAVSVSGIAINGTDAGNYTFNATASTTANVAARSLTVTATGVNKVYDGTTAATVTLSDDRVSGDVFTDSYGSAAFTDANVGTGKAVSVSGIGISGTDAGNYALQNITAATTATITAAPTSTAVSAATITYNQNGSVTVTVSSAVGTPGGQVSLTVDNGTPLTQALVNGSTTFTITSPSFGDHGLSASYAAQGNYAASTATGNLHVNAVTTSVTVSAPDLTYNADGSVTVTVSNLSGTSAVPTGSVTLSGVGIGADQTKALNNGSATFTITSPGGGSHSVSASYAPDSTNFGAASGSGSLTVHAAATGIGVVAPDVTYKVDGSVAVTVTSPAGTPTGNVSLTIDGNTTTQALSNGSTTFTVGGPSAGDHSLSVGYAGDGNFAAQTTTGNLHVARADTGVSIDAPQVTYNGDATVTVTVNSQTAPTPSGNVTLAVDGADFATLPVDNNGQAVFTITSPSAGTHSLSATFAPDTTDYNGQAATGSLSVKAAATSVAIDSSNVVFNENSPVTVTVSSAVGTPGGTVTLQLDGGTVQSATLDANGRATFSVTGPDNNSTHTLTASYAAQGNYDASGATFGVYSQQAQTSVGISAPAITYNANGTVTVTVTSPDSPPPPSGSVSLSLDGGVPVVQALDGNGQSVFTLPSPSAGDHNLAVSYGGDADFAGSTAGATLHVAQAPTTTGVSAPTVTYDAHGLVTVTVSSASGTPGGSVSLSVDGGAAMTGTLSGGSYTFNVAALDAGDHTLTAGYAAQGNFAGSSTGSAVLHVNQAATGIDVSAPSITYDADGSVIVTVSNTSGTSAVPSGNITLTVDGQALPAQALDGTGSTTFTITSPSAGDHSLRADYDGGTDFASGTTYQTLHVDQAATRIAGSAPEVTYNADGVITVTVSPQQAGVPTPAGNVTLTIDGQTYTAALDGGQASFTITSPSAGSHPYTVSYAAQGNFAASSDSSGRLLVNPAATAVTITAPDVTYNQHGSVTVTVSPTQPGVPAPTGVVSLTVDGGTAYTYTLVGGDNGAHTFDIGVLDAGTHTLSANYDAQGNFAGSSLGGNLIVNQAAASIMVSPYGGTYDGQAHGLTGSATGVNGEDLGGLLHLGPTYTDAGHYTVTWTFEGNTNYKAASGTADIDITRADAVITVTSYSGTYDGQAHGLTGSAKGVEATPADLTGLLHLGPTYTNAGTYTVTWTFDGNTDYKSATGTSTVTISQAALTVTVGGVSKVYGQTVDLAATLGTAVSTGVNGENLSITYSSDGAAADASVTNGPYAITAVVSDGTGLASNYDVTIKPGLLSVAKADATVGVTPYGGTYDGAAHGLTGSAVGVLGENLIGLLDLGASHRDAGHYVVTWSFAGNADYNAAGGSSTIDITPAPVTYTLGNDGQTYGSPADLAADLGTTLATGVNGERLGITYGSGGDTATADVGTYDIAGTLSDGPDGKLSNYSVTLHDGTLAVTPADLYVTANANSKTYGQTAADSGSVSGVLNNDGITATFASDGDAATAHVGDYTISATLSDPNHKLGDYTFHETDATLAVNKADATIAVSGYGVTYDGSAHTATGTATGVFGESLSGLDLSGTAHTGAGTSADSWTFTDVTGDYNGATGTVNDAIGKADASITITPYNATYDSQAHGLSGSAKGVNGEDLSGLLHLGTTYTDAGQYSATWTFDGDGDYNAASGSNVIAIGQATVTGHVTAQGKAYDGTKAVTLASQALTGVIGNDDVSLVVGSASFDSKDAGAEGVTATGLGLTGAKAADYVLSSTTATATATISQRALTVTATADSKVYDGTRTTTEHLADDRVSGDLVTVSDTGAAFDSKDVGTGKTVTVSGISISGTDAGNYTVNTVATAQADVSPAPLTIAAVGDSKTYDGGTKSSAAPTSSGLFTAGGDTITGLVQAFDSRNVLGTGGSTLGVTGYVVNDGVGGADYTVQLKTATGTISPLAITGSVTAGDKVYDAGIGARITGRSLTGAVGGDDVSYVGGTATFADKNAGAGKTVTAIGLSLAGMDAGNYTVNDTATTAADITPAPLTVSTSALNKVYDGTTAAAVTLSDNHLANDVVGLHYAGASFADKNVSTGKAVSVSGISIDGADAGNYQLTDTTATTTADITARALTVSATGVNKVYDGGTTATVTLSDNRVSGDVFSDGYTAASFADKSVGSGKAVSVSGISISGADAGNYTFNTAAGTTASITARALTVTATGVNKVYDGTTAATVTLSDNRVSGDVFTDSYGSAAFADANVGTGKAVSVSGIGISGADAGNYALQNTAATTAANITAAGTSVTGTSSGSPSRFGDSVTFTAAVSNSQTAATPTGSVQFVIDGASYGSPLALDAGGHASISLTSLAVGSHTVVTNYTSSDGNFVNGTGNTVQTVGSLSAGSAYVLSTSASGAVTASGNAVVKLPGGLYVDSNSAGAILASGNAQVNVGGTVQVVGGVSKSGNAAVTKTGTPAATNDPLAGLTAPSLAGLTNYGAVSIAGKSTQTLCPGIYTSIQVSGNAVVTMNPGTYILLGGGLAVTGNASLSGNGVFLFNAGSAYANDGVHPAADGGNFGGITLSGNGNFNLTPAAGGPYAGILIYQSRANTRALSIGGNATVNVNGTVYAANAMLSISGNGTLNDTLVVSALNVSGNVNLAETAAGSDVAGDVMGVADTLLAGDLHVYVDNSGDYFTADELARIDDAVANWDAVLAPYNVSITLVSDPAAADLVLDAGTTSASGDKAGGVLGCFNPDKAEITVIEGWDWYAGADPAGIGAEQYDFETTVMHELGHAVGLGHSPNSDSPMNGVLPTATARHVMTAADLNIPDSPDGADPLTAAGYAPAEEGAAGPASGRPAEVAPGRRAVSQPVPGGVVSLVPDTGAGAGLGGSRGPDAAPSRGAAVPAWEGLIGQVAVGMPAVSDAVAWAVASPPVAPPVPQGVRGDRGDAAVEAAAKDWDSGPAAARWHASRDTAASDPGAEPVAVDDPGAAAVADGDMAGGEDE